MTSFLEPLEILMADRNYHAMAGGHIGPKEMLNGAAAVCLLLVAIDAISWAIDGIKFLGHQLGF